MSNKSVLTLQLLQNKLILCEYKGDKSVLESFKFELEITHDSQSVVSRNISDKLKSENIRTTDVIIIPQPAEVLVRNISIPPLSDMSMLKGIVSSRLDRELKISSDDMVLDYCGVISSQQQNNILIAGLQKKRNTALCNICENAGLTPIAIVPEFAWLHKDHIKAGANENLIYITDSTAAIATIDNGNISNVAWFNTNNLTTQSSVSKIASELLRNPVFSETQQRKFKVISKQPDIANELDKMTSDDYSFFQATEPFNDSTSDIASIYFSKKGFAINFIHNHFTGKKKSQLSNNSRKIIIAVLVLLAFVAWFFIDWQSDKNQIKDDESFITGIEDQVKASKDVIDKIKKARMWSNTESYFSKCLSDISDAFPDADSIWTNSLVLDEDLTIEQDFSGVLTGSSLSNTNVENMLKGLSQNPHFSDVKTRYIRQAGTNTSELSFAIEFDYSVSITEDNKTIEN